MRKMEHLAEFPHNVLVMQFMGKTYEEAVANANSGGNFDYYYEQEFGRNKRGQSKTILVCYHEHILG